MHSYRRAGGALVSALCTGISMLACGAPAESSSVVAAGQPLFGATTLKPLDWPNVVKLDGKCTGVLVRSNVVVYAAHCGTVTMVRVGELAVPTAECENLPGWSMLGTDLAFCRLSEPLNVPVTPPATGCELDGLAIGATLTVVGYGLADDTDGFGTKRTAEVKVEALSPEIVVSAPSVGSCAGDSGGPALIRLIKDDRVVWRLVGVLSTGQTGCKEGKLYLTPVSAFVPWLEEASRHDLTPCGSSDGTWAPTAHCWAEPVVADSNMGSRTSGAWPEAYWGGCGAPFDASLGDHSAPSLRLTWPPEGEVIEARENTATADVVLQASVTDAEWGVDEVRVELFWNGEPVAKDTTSLPAYAFGPFQLRTGEYVARIEAIDYAGHLGVFASSFAVESNSEGCGIVRGWRNTSFPPSIAFALVAWMALRRRRMGAPRRTLARDLSSEYSTVMGAMGRDNSRTPRQAQVLVRISRLLARIAPSLLALPCLRCAINACDSAGCVEGTEVRLTSPIEGSESYTIQVDWDDGQLSCSMSGTSSRGECDGRNGITADIARGPLGGPAVPRFTMQGLLTTNLTVRILRDGAVLKEQSFQPAYQTVQPNGPECPSTCRYASVTL